MGTSSTKFTSFVHRIFSIINVIFPPLFLTLYAGRTKLVGRSACHAGCISVCHLQNGTLGVHLSGSQKDGIWDVLNWDCRENEGEQIEGADRCVSSDG
jgi:hypothetical protein